MSSAISLALGLEPCASTADVKPGSYLYIHADGYNQSFHSVESDEVDSFCELYAEESEPVELGIAIRISNPHDELSLIFQRIFDETITRGLIEDEKGYIDAKNNGLEAQGVESKFFSINASSVDLIETGRSGEWECLYKKDGLLQYVGECDNFEFEETDEDVFTAGYAIESIKSYALADVLEDGSIKLEIYESTAEIIDALEKKGLFDKPDIIEQFKSKYSGKTFTIFGTYEWCEDEKVLHGVLVKLGLQLVDEMEAPEVVFVGEIDTSTEGIYDRWEAIVGRCPIQHGKFTEPLLSEVFAKAS